MLYVWDTRSQLTVDSRQNVKLIFFKEVHTKHFLLYKFNGKWRFFSRNIFLHDYNTENPKIHVIG